MDDRDHGTCDSSIAIRAGSGGAGRFFVAAPEGRDPMGRGSGGRRAAEIEIQWHQSDQEGWIAVLTERKTKRRWEVRTESELRAILTVVAAAGNGRSCVVGARRRSERLTADGRDGKPELADGGEPGRDGGDR
jgi:hypothetical protein